MVDFSIEEQASRIYNSKTKEYFEEVRISYSVGNYRSCVVVLYSVVICDLVYKLQDLRDLHEDERAGKILNKVQEMQAKNPKSPQWESDLIDLIGKSTELMDTHERTHLEHLQQHRHLSAHPVLTNDNLLFRPSKEVARAHIRHMLEGVLTKPPILSAKITGVILKRIAENDKQLEDILTMKKFLVPRFLNDLREITLQKVFKDFWKIVFVTQNEQCDKNRLINAYALSAMYEYNQSLISKSIKDEPNYYSNVNLSDGMIIGYLFDFCRQYPEVYRILDESVKVLMSTLANNNANLYIKSWFIWESDTEHFKSVMKILKNDNSHRNTKIREQTLYYYCEYLIEKDLQEEYSKLLFFLWSHIGTYNTADARYDWFIKPALKDKRLNKEQLIQILEISNGNSQIYDRASAAESIKEIYQSLIEVGGSIDFNDYPNLNRYFS